MNNWIIHLFNYFVQFHSSLSLSLLVLLLPGVSSTLNVIVCLDLPCLPEKLLFTLWNPARHHLLSLSLLYIPFPYLVCVSIIAWVACIIMTRWHTSYHPSRWGQEPCLTHQSISSVWLVPDIQYVCRNYLLNWSESRFFLCCPSSTNAFEGLITLILVLSVQFSSFAQSCSPLCSPMDCSMPFFPVHYQLLELAQTQVHQVGDAIKPSHLVLYYILTQRFPIVLWSYKFW